ALLSPFIPISVAATDAYFANNPKLHAQTIKQANISAITTRTLKSRRPSGYSLLYSRWSRWYLDQYQPTAANCSSFGSLQFTLSTISKFARAETKPQIEMHASAAIPTMRRVVIHAHSKPLKPGNHLNHCKMFSRYS